MTRPCLVCGKPIACNKSSYNHKIYCSAECRRSTEYITVNCLRCNKEYSVAKSRYFKMGLRYHHCSNECYDEFKKERNAGRKKNIVYVCKNCGEKFSGYRNGNNKFCSQECSLKFHKGINSPSYKHGKTIGNSIRKIFVIDKIDGEIWVPVPNFVGFYEVSNFGRLKSLERVEETNGRFGPMLRKRSERLIYSDYSKNKYKNIELYRNKNGSFTKIPIHRIVYDSFCGPITEGNMIHHIDFNKTNNKLNNLQSVSVLEHNRIHTHESWSKGKKFEYYSKKNGDERSGKSVRCIETNKIYKSINSAANDISCNPHSISAVINKRREKIKNYSFECVNE